MDGIIWFIGMFVVGYNCDVASCPAVIDFSEWEGREGGKEGMGVLRGEETCCTQGEPTPIKKHIFTISTDYLGSMHV